MADDPSDDPGSGVTDDTSILGVDEPPELGAAFKDSETAARVFTGAPAAADLDVSDEPSGPWLRPAVDQPTVPVEIYGEPRTLTVQRSGDDEVDAMLMLRAVMDSVESPIARRRLLGWLADRYA